MAPVRGGQGGGPEPGRVAQVIVTRADGRRLLGSGYRVTSGSVLTAAHVVRDARSVTVRFDADQPTAWTAESTDVRTDGDVAVLVLPPGAGAGGVQPVPFGRVGARAAVVGCVAVGFPRFKLRHVRSDSQPGGAPTADTRPYRDRVQAVGRIPVLSNSREDTFEVITDPPAADPDHSPWEGMSGAAVWSGGRIVGVVSRHHRTDSPGRLAAARIDHWREALASERREVFDRLLGLPRSPLPDVVPPDAGEIFASGYAAQVRDTAPDELLGRDGELAELVGFCAGDQPYAWWQGAPWAGKSALAAWFVLHPPAGVIAVSFFITSRLAGQSDSDAFTDTLLEELAALVGEALPAVATPAGRDRERRRLLDRAAAVAAEQGRRLLVVVDGLDEDTGAGPGGRLPSIASLLPRTPPDGLRVLVTSRPHPGLPDDVPASHPLRRCVPRRLDPSPFARDMAQTARWELTKGLYGGEAGRDVLCYLTACGGGLTRSELARLVDAPEWELDGLLGSVFGRTLRTRRLPDSDRVYLFGHETLRRIAEAHLAGDLDPYRARIRQWAEDHQRRGWPEDTPGYLLRPYGALLAATGETDRLVALATDPARHDRMLARQHNDADALAEIRAAGQALLARGEVDLAALGTVAVAEWRLKNRNTNIPIELPAVWARIGDPRRAERSARAITDPYHRAEALTQVAEAVAGTDPDRAERIARTVTDPDRRARALTRVAAAVAGTDPDRARRLAEGAERVARTIVDPDRRARALTQVAAAVAGTEPDQPCQVGRAVDAAERVARTVAGSFRRAGPPAEGAERVAGSDAGSDAEADAERVARAIADPGRRAQALTEVAAAIADVDPDRTRAVAEDAERSARTVSNPYQLAEALTEVAAAIARTDPERGERVARAIADPYHRARALTGVAVAVARTDPDQAGPAIDAAERAARTVADPDRRARVLTDVAGVVAHRDPDRAERAALAMTDPYHRDRALTAVARVVMRADPDRAERVALAIAGTDLRARALCRLAGAVTGTDPDRAGGVAGAAERVARTVPDPDERARVLVEVAGAVAGTDPDRAESIARALGDRDRQSRALRAVADAVAGRDPDRAERVARSIGRPFHRVRALTAVAVAVAGTDPDRAERLAREITDPDRQSRALRKVAAAMAGRDPVRAERVARTIADADARNRALCGVAGAVVGRDPDQARRIAAEVTAAGAWLDALGVTARLDPHAVRTVGDYLVAVLAPGPDNR